MDSHAFDLCRVLTNPSQSTHCDDLVGDQAYEKVTSIAQVLACDVAKIVVPRPGACVNAVLVEAKVMELDNGAFIAVPIRLISNSGKSVAEFLTYLTRDGEWAETAG